MRGMGDQIIRVPLYMLQSMMEGDHEMTNWRLPRSVDIVGVIHDPGLHNPYIPDERTPSVMFRIKHKYCFRRPPGSQLCIEDYTAFIERFRSIAEADARGN